jgi:phage gp46-like protein
LLGPRSQCNYLTLSYKRIGQAPILEKGSFRQVQLRARTIHNNTLSVDVEYYALAARTT